MEGRVFVMFGDVIGTSPPLKLIKEVKKVEDGRRLTGIRASLIWRLVLWASELCLRAKAVR